MTAFIFLSRCCFLTGKRHLHCSRMFQNFRMGIDHLSNIMFLFSFPCFFTNSWCLKCWTVAIIGVGIFQSFLGGPEQWIQSNVTLEAGWDLQIKSFKMFSCSIEEWWEDSTISEKTRLSLAEQICRWRTICLNCVFGCCGYFVCKSFDQSF